MDDTQAIIQSIETLVRVMHTQQIVLEQLCADQQQLIDSVAEIKEYIEYLKH